MDLTIPVTEKEPTKGFDYSAMDQDTAKFAETKAAEIWQRHERMVDDWVGNARALGEVREQFGISRVKGKFAQLSKETFAEWVGRETPYTNAQAKRMIQAASLLTSGQNRSPVAVGALVELGAGEIPKKVISAVLDRDGDPVSYTEARQINRVARNMDSEAPLPSPAQANKIARETGQALVASDGRLYLGLTPEEVAQGKAENKLDFGIIDGVKFFSSITTSPEEWLAQDSSALMEWSVTNPPPIREAADWLRGLAKAWKEYAKSKSINGETHEAAE